MVTVRAAVHVLGTFVALLSARNATSASASASASGSRSRGRLNLSSDEQRLFHYLMRRYEKSVRPPLNASDPVTVAIGISLNQIADLDERSQVLTTIVWLNQEWLDQKLLWDPSEFGGMAKIRIPSYYLWLPDIVLYNAVDDYQKAQQSLAMIRNNGLVFWPPVLKLRSSCKIDIKWFPFDAQVCSLKLGSWAYDGFQVDITNRSSEVDTTNFITNGEWDVIATRVRRNVKWYPCCPEPFPDMTFYVHLQRRHLYYVMNIILPCMMMSLLTMTTFALPAESGEKISLGLTVMLSFSVFMSLIAEMMPPTSETAPLASVYLTTIMGLSAASVIMSVVVLNVYMRGKDLHAPPRMIQTFCRYLSVVLFFNFDAAGYCNAHDDCKRRQFGKHSKSASYSRLPLSESTPEDVDHASTCQFVSLRRQWQLEERIRLQKSKKFHRKRRALDSEARLRSSDSSAHTPVRRKRVHFTLEERQEAEAKQDRWLHGEASDCDVDFQEEEKQQSDAFSTLEQLDDDDDDDYNQVTSHPSAHATLQMNANGLSDEEECAHHASLQSRAMPEAFDSSSSCVCDPYEESWSDDTLAESQLNLLEEMQKRRLFLDEQEKCVTLWQQVSSLLDRLLLTIFVGATLLASLTMLVIIPQTREVYTESMLTNIIENDRLQLEEHNLRAHQLYAVYLNNTRAGTS